MMFNVYFDLYKIIIVDWNNLNIVYQFFNIKIKYVNSTTCTQKKQRIFNSQNPVLWAGFKDLWCTNTKENKIIHL